MTDEARNEPQTSDERKRRCKEGSKEPLRRREPHEPTSDEEWLVDESSDESFPASDPPAFTSSHAGRPQR